MESFIGYKVEMGYYIDKEIFESEETSFINYSNDVFDDNMYLRGRGATHFIVSIAETLY